MLAPDVHCVVHGPVAQPQQAWHVQHHVPCQQRQDHAPAAVPAALRQPAHDPCNAHEPDDVAAARDVPHERVAAFPRQDEVHHRPLAERRREDRQAHHAHEHVQPKARSTAVGAQSAARQQHRERLARDRYGRERQLDRNLREYGGEHRKAHHQRYVRQQASAWQEQVDQGIGTGRRVCGRVVACSHIGLLFNGGSITMAFGRGQHVLTL